MLKMYFRLVSFLFGISMVSSLYLMEYCDLQPARTVWGYDTYYYTVLPFTIFLLSYFIPGRDTFFDN